MLGSKKIWYPVLVLTMSFASFAVAKCPLGDLNADCQVNLQDLQVFAEQWLASPGSPADLNRDEQVCMADFALLVRDWHVQGIALVINELMAANSTCRPDPMGEYDDWIEIYNTGDKAIDMGGMYLTDDLSRPTMWRVPADKAAETTVPPHGYLLIWADADTGQPGLHANFKLDAAGEEIGLFDTDGRTLIDNFRFGEQTGDISFGRFPDGSDDLRFSGFPSPGAQNIGEYIDAVADTKFSHDRGFYDEPFDVTIATETEGAIIYYTLDGSEPYQTGGRFPTGKVYTDPIHISTTTCLRAKAIKQGWLSSNADTHTYIFLKDVIVRSQAQVLAAGYPSRWYASYFADYEMDPEIYNNPAYRDLMQEALLSIPTVSMVTDKGNFFNLENDRDTGGIYIYTGHSSTGGRGWERPVSVEFFSADSTQEFQINCGVRIQGGENRRPDKCPKHGFGLRFRGKYGPARLEFPLFDAWPVDSFETIQFRGFFNNSWVHWASQQRARAQYIRDQWMRDSLTEMGHLDAGQGFFVHLYLNGIYWGLYNLHERPVASHYAAYNGGDRDYIDAINGGSPTDGGLVAWNQTRSIVASRNWEQIQKVLDIDNFIDWTIVNNLAGNTDLKNNGNWRAAGGGPDRRPWHFYSWDGEHIFESLNQRGTRPSSDATGLYRYLEDIKEFRVRFADRVHKHFFNGGALTRERNAQRWTKRANEIDLAVIGESARWGDYRRDVHSWSSGPYELYTKNGFWIPEKNKLLNEYFPYRTQIVLDHFRDAGLYPNVDAPVFHINGSYQHGGHISPDDLFSVTAKGGTVWYTLDGNDPRVPGTTPQQSDTHILVSENAVKRVLVPTDVVRDPWKGGHAFDDSAWTSSTGGVGYERGSGYQGFIGIDVSADMYNQNASCYIRIPFTVSSEDLAGFKSITLRVRYDDGFVAYLNGVEIARRNFSGTPAWDSSADGIHSDALAVVFEDVDVSDHISAMQPGDNTLALHGLNSSTTSSDFLISVELAAGKTSSSDGDTSAGAIKYTGPITLTKSTQVKARALSGSTWSALNEATFAIGPVKESLRITEIMYHPQDTNDPNDPNEEFIELQNIGPEKITINLVKFTGGINFTFPDLELAPDKYVLVVKDQAAFDAQYPDFIGLVAGQYIGSLANNGERIRLEDAAGQTILNFRYRDGWYDITDGVGFSLTIKDPYTTEPNDWGEKYAWRPSSSIGGSPGADDTGVVPELGSIKINELLAHSHAGDPDWIELHNTTSKAINIGGWFLSDDRDNLTKYEIAEGTIIDPCGYVVFYQDLHFGNINNSGCHELFALSENGETLYLHSGRDGILTGYSEEEKFGPSETGIAFARYKKSTGTFNFVAMSENTPGSANAYPEVGPVVINEIMYHPQNNGDAEYVELLNISGGSVVLQEWDNEQGKHVPWRLADEGGISFDFPLGTTMAAGEYILLVRNLSAFEYEFGAVGGGVQVFDWELGKLDNGSEKIQLSKPGDEVEGTRYYIRVDRVNYSDGSHPVGEDPWPTEADGSGSSLSRKDASDYGNDVINWQAASASPGTTNP